MIKGLDLDEQDTLGAFLYSASFPLVKKLIMMSLQGELEKLQSFDLDRGEKELFLAKARYDGARTFGSGFANALEELKQNTDKRMEQDKED